MKDLTLSAIVGVLGLALGIGLVFHWVYPLVALSAELAGVFVFAAIFLRLVLAKAWGLLHKAPAHPEAEPRK